MRRDTALKKVKTVAAFFSAGLSTLLAVNEWRKSWVEFDTSYFFTAEPDTDDIVVLYNKSSKPITIIHFEFFKGLKRNDSNKRYHSLGTEGSFTLFSIAPRESFKIRISDQYKFGNVANTKIFLELTIMGRSKRKIVEIYPN